MNIDTVIYASGEIFFEELGKKYVQHPKGLFIMTPSGAGKTYFCSRQEEQHWIDGDTVLTDAGAQPQNDWWNQGVPVILDEESDAGQAYSDAVDRLLGKEVPHRFLEVQKKGFLQRMFGGKE